MIRDEQYVGGYQLFSITEKEETKAEIIRLLYVATTRAADYLVLSSGLDKLGKIEGPWMELLDQRFDRLTGKARKSTHQVKVVTSPPPLKIKPTKTTGRQTLKKLLQKAQKKAQKGEGRLPKYLAPVAPDKAARRQFSFSRLTGVLHERTPASIITVDETEEFPEKALDPLGLGTLVHAVLAEVDFTNPGDYTEIVRRIKRDSPNPQLADGTVPLSPEVDLEEAIEMIGRFLASSRASEIATAKEVHRELEFMLAWPPGSRDPEGRYLQGFIDCLYRDAAGQWQIVDYKTNRITAEYLEVEAAKYQMQMLLYALAAETILKESIVELTLYFLRPGLEYHFSWNDIAKQRVIDLINQHLS